MKFIHIWKTFFEYFFFRIAKLNLKITKPDRAITSVTAVQFVIIMNLLLAMCLYIFPDIKRNFRMYEIIILLVIFFTIDHFNTKIYEGRYEVFDKRWGDEPKKKRIIGMLVVIGFIIFSFSLFFINAWIFDRFKKY